GHLSFTLATSSWCSCTEVAPRAGCPCDFALPVCGGANLSASGPPSLDTLVSAAGHVSMSQTSQEKTHAQEPLLYFSGRICAAGFRRIRTRPAEGPDW